MGLNISDQQLSRLSDFIDENMGLHFPRRRWSDLQRGLTAASLEFGFDDVADCAQWLMSATLTKAQLEILASHLTVGETYFFRERKSFATLADHILPELIRSRGGVDRRLRIWSAACCTGEEPYSFAILLHQTIADWKHWNLTLLATDINPRFLRKAAAGVYGRWSFRDTQDSIIDRYFQKTADGRFEIVPEIKAMVSFAQLNLADDVYPSLVNGTNAMDVILCRNVLMYFSAHQAGKIIQKLYRAQADGGWLVVSPSESSHVLYRPYLTINFPGVIFYRKGAPQTPSMDAPALENASLVSERASGAKRSFVPEIESQPQGPTPTAPVEPSDSAEPGLTSYAEAAALYEDGKYTEATEKLVQLASGRLPPPQVFSLLVRALANQGKLSEALDWCDQGIAADKLNPSAHYLRAIVLQEQGADENAMDSLQRALYLKQDFVLAHFALANLARRCGKDKTADKHLANALELLRVCPTEAVLPESEGMTAGRLTEIIISLMKSKTLI
jgi:chemotaxis protein methyltransferase CheR